MELFALNDEVARLEDTLAALSGLQLVHALLQLAWQLRQRDTRRAMALVDQIRDLLPHEHCTPPQKNDIVQRLKLIQAEVQWLAARLDLAWDMAQSVLAAVGSDAPIAVIISADAHYLLAWIAHDLGDGVTRDQHLQAMLDLTRDSDAVRATIAQATLARFAVFREGQPGAARWTPHFAGPFDTLHPAARCWVEDFLGFAGQASNYYEQLIQHHDLTNTMALRTGQIRQAITSATNLGENFGILGDYKSALEWMQHALDLARETGWPRCLGKALLQMAQILRLLHRHESALGMLHEALAILAPLVNSRAYAVALSHLGQLEIDCAQFESALATLERVEQRAGALAQIDLQSDSRCHQAKALLALGRPEAALQKAMAAAAHVGTAPATRINALLIMAEAHSHDELPVPCGISAASVSLHYLQQALMLAQAADHNRVAPELLDALAREHAKIGDYRQAYDFAMQARQTREGLSNREAANRAIALQINDQTERAQMESEYHRQLAAAEASQAALSQQTSNILTLLGTIGQEITTHLEPQEIFEVLHQYVHDLFDTTSFTIYRYDDSTAILFSVFDIEEGKPLPTEILSMSHPDSPAVRCARERREIMLDFDPAQVSPPPFANSLSTLSCLFAPLCQAEKLLGVISIQSRRRHAYGMREELIFRTLCAYAAIALGNALAHQNLHATQAQLIHAEKMASLGQLVANIAHEINTPIGAIKSSGGNITDALEQTLIDLPKLFKLLNQSEENLFLALIQCASTVTDVLSSREEREITREVRTQLQQLGIPDPVQRGATLVQLHAQSALEDVLPLLRHPQANFILKSAQNIAAIINNTANINLAVERVSRIVFALKSFAHHDEDDRMRPGNLRDGLETVLTLYGNQIKNGIELVRRYENIAPLPCWQDQLNQVWTNLIHNALQAMDGQGTLTLCISRNKDEAIVSISDSGCGIAPEHRDKIFTPFFTTKARGEGSGLGLDIVKKIIDKHQGRIEVRSEVGVGTTFSLFLPYATGTTEPQNILT